MYSLPPNKPTPLSRSLITHNVYGYLDGVGGQFIHLVPGR